MPYIRKYELTISDSSYKDEINTPDDEVVADKNKEKISEKDFRTIPVEARIITDLHMEADITYSINKTSSSNQPATIKLYNLSPATQNFIKADGVVFLKAGFEQVDTFEEEVEESGEKVQTVSDSNLPLIFTGQIERVYTEKQGQDTLTTIVCKDSGFNQKVVHLSKGFNRGESYRSVIQYILSYAANAGLPTGYFNDSGEGAAARLDRTLTSGMSIEGNLLEELSTICSNIGYKSYVSLGKIHVEPKEATQRLEAVILKPINIKGSIRVEESKEGDSSKGSGKIQGVRVNTFINGSISTNKMMKIQSGDYEGLYKITDVSHTLSYEGDQWDTEIVGTKVG